MVYRYALDSPFRMQWDSSSRLPAPDPGLAPGNCGVTCVVMVAEYYNDRPFGIYATRRLANFDNKPSTTVNQQREMLVKRGVPCRVQRPSLASITSLLASGKRPIIVGLDMSKVPQAIAGHPFRERHGIVLRANAVQGGIRGKLAADPNFSTRTGRLDSTRGRRFYPDYILQAAYFNSGMWAIVPDHDKRVAPPPAPPLPEDDVNPDWYKPIAVCSVAAGGTVYADPLRRKVLIQTWVGQATVGLYALPVTPTSKSLVPVRIEVSSRLRIGYIGLDKVSNVRFP